MNKQIAAKLISGEITMKEALRMARRNNARRPR